MNVAATYRTLDGEAWDEADVAKIPSNWDEAWNVSNGLKYLIALNKDASAADELNSFHAYDKRTAISKGIDTDALSYNEDGYAIVVRTVQTALCSIQRKIPILIAMFPFLCTPILAIHLLAQRPFKESNA